jgi:hypothetical protein
MDVMVSFIWLLLYYFFVTNDPQVILFMSNFDSTFFAFAQYPVYLNSTWCQMTLILIDRTSIVKENAVTVGFYVLQISGRLEWTCSKGTLNVLPSHVQNSLLSREWFLHLPWLLFYSMENLWPLMWLWMRLGSRNLLVMSQRRWIFGVDFTWWCYI